MNKEFCNYTQSLALKELGFDEPCFGYYDTVAVTYLTYPSAINKNSDIENSLSISKQDKNVRCSAPLYQQAFSFFREKHNLSGWISHSGWYHIISKSIEINEKILSEKYEEAESACLYKLIEICKNK
jgi:hypothetical protein